MLNKSLLGSWGRLGEILPKISDRCVHRSFKMDKFEPTTPNMSQHVATRWPNARNILHPAMSRYFALTCCVRLAGASQIKDVQNASTSKLLPPCINGICSCFYLSDAISSSISQTLFEIYETTNGRNFPVRAPYISHFICSYNLNYNFRPPRGPSIILIMIRIGVWRALKKLELLFAITSNNSNASFLHVAWRQKRFKLVRITVGNNSNKGTKISTQKYRCHTKRSVAETFP